MVSFDSLSQELKADARVQYASDLKVDDPELAKAIITVADAIARGDADKFGRKLAKPSKVILTSMVTDGLWEKGTKDIEAVRVVYAGTNPENDQPKVSADDALKYFAGDNSSLPEGLPAMTPEKMQETLKAINEAMGGGFDPKQFGGTLDPEKLKKVSEAFTKLKDDPAKTAALQKVLDAISGAGSIPGLKGAQSAVLLAVQHTDGVDLIGLGAEKAFDSWTFSYASTDGTKKARAAEWDGIGAAGFSKDSRSAALPKPAAKKDDGTPGGGTEGTAPEGGNGGNDNKKKDPEPGQKPGEKRTPHGPVKIPGSGSLK